MEGQLAVIRASLPKPPYTDQFAVAEIQNTNLGQQLQHMSMKTEGCNFGLNYLTREGS